MFEGAFGTTAKTVRTTPFDQPPHVGLGCWPQELCRRSEDDKRAEKEGKIINLPRVLSLQYGKSGETSERHFAQFYIYRDKAVPPLT